MAARGIESYSAVVGSWAMAMPPPALISRNPAMPSEPMPESTTPIPGPSGPLASE